jgi:putative FmdB family regulatory protein
MPTYEYRCDACDHSFELFQSIKAPSVRKCPQCGKLKVRRLIGIGAGVIFKGSGFYQTDYRSESYRKDAEKDKPAKSEKKADSTKDSEKTKPAKTPE